MVGFKLRQQTTCEHGIFAQQLQAYYVYTSQAWVETEKAILFGLNFLPLADLKYCTDSNTQYLKVKFRLFLKAKVNSY